MTLKAGTYYASDTGIEITSANGDVIVSTSPRKFTLDKDTEIKVKVGTNSSHYPVVVKAQIEMGNTATAYEPYTDGKPSPSPDYPQDITVIENPVVNVCGRNILDTSAYYRAGYSNSVAYVHLGDVRTLPLTAKASDGFGVAIKMPPGTYQVRAKNYTPTAVFTLATYKSKSDIFDPTKHIWMLPNKFFKDSVPFTISGKDFVWLVICCAADWKGGTGTAEYTTDFKLSLEVQNASGEFVPYSCQQRTFKLPAEHPYLAKLPDGTADEIVVDSEGNVELVARIGVDRDVRNVDDFSQGKFYSLRTTIPFFASASTPSVLYNRPVLCSALPRKETAVNNEGIYRTWNGIYVVDKSGRTKAETQAEVNRNAPLTVVAVIPETRYSLGKIEIPKAQDSIINVWTDAEVTPSTGIGYVRDVNIVVANIEKAIASITEG